MSQPNKIKLEKTSASLCPLNSYNCQIDVDAPLGAVSWNPGAKSLTVLVFCSIPMTLTLAGSFGLPDRKERAEAPGDNFP